MEQNKQNEIDFLMQTEFDLQNQLDRVRERIIVLLEDAEIILIGEIKQAKRSHLRLVPDNIA